MYKALSQALLAVSHSQQVRSLVETTPLTRPLVNRFVAGSELDGAVGAVRHLAGQGLLVTVDHLGEDTVERAQASAHTDAYVRLLSQLGQRGLAASAEVSLKLSALGQTIGDGGEKLALDNARTVCQRARDLGTTVTVDMENHTTTDSTLSLLHQLRRDFPETGAVLQSALRRTEADCRELAHEGSRVRLCKGAYAEPPSVAFQDRLGVDRSYVRCLKALLAGGAYPMIASHDPRIIQLAGALASRYGRERDTYEYQMLYGARAAEQRRLASLGHRVRVYVPFGEEWYGYLVRRLAERPANLAFFARTAVTNR